MNLYNLLNVVLHELIATLGISKKIALTQDVSRLTNSLVKYFGSWLKEGHGTSKHKLKGRRDDGATRMVVL